MTFLGQLKRELIISSRSSSDVANPLIFFFLGVMLFGIAAAGDPKNLQNLGPAIVWVLILLANMLSLDSMYRQDHADGSLEQLILLSETPFVPILAKILVQWLLSGFTLTLLAPVAALLVFMPANEWPVLMLTLLLGSPALSFFGSICAALTVGARRTGVLLGLLALPLYVPVLIFGVGVMVAHVEGMSMNFQIYWLMAISILSITIAPHAVYAALKLSVDE